MSDTKPVRFIFSAFLLGDEWLPWENSLSDLARLLGGPMSVLLEHLTSIIPGTSTGTIGSEWRGARLSIWYQWQERSGKPVLLLRVRVREAAAAAGDSLAA